MRKIVATLAAVLAAALIGGAVPASASSPDRPNIIDPADDANGLNDQGFGDVTVQGHSIGFQGDKEGGSFAAADLREIWFTNDHRELRLNIRTTEPPTRSDLGLALRVETNLGCLRFEALVPGRTYGGEARATVRSVRSDRCGGGSRPVEGSLRVVGLPDTTGLTTLAFRLGSHPNLQPWSWLFRPDANVRLALGNGDLGALRAVQIDNTKPGLNYQIAVVPPPAPAPQEPSIDKPAPPGQSKDKNKDKKGKGKGHEKNGCKHKGKGQGHPEDECPEEDQDGDQRSSLYGKPFVF